MGTTFVAVVGMTGAGKSAVADILVEHGFHYVRFGQITLDEVKRRGLAPSEENERPIREEFRKLHGKGAYAILNIPKFDALLTQGNVVGDGLYSWEEYKILKDKYGSNMIVVAIHTSPTTRYARLAARTLHAHDVAMRNRPATAEQARARDFAEIENIDKGGPIAMADYHIVNEGSPEELQVKLNELLHWIEAKQ